MRSDCKIDATEHIKKHLTRTHMRNIQRTISHNHLINDIQKFYNEKKRRNTTGDDDGGKQIKYSFGRFMAKVLSLQI